MIVLGLILAYMICVVGFMAWDALVGLPVDFDGYDNPPLWLVALFWPIAFPCMLAMSTNNLFKTLKEKRIERAEVKQKIRVRLLSEDQKLMKQIEEELEEELEEEISNERKSFYPSRLG